MLDTCSPDDAYRLQTQIQSFNLRFRQQCSNASRLAGYLEEGPEIRKVWYPGLKNHPTHILQKSFSVIKDLERMITFDFNGMMALRRENEGMIL